MHALFAKAVSALRGWRAPYAANLKDLTEDVEVLYPASSGPAVAAAMPAGHMERILAVQSDTNLPAELKRLKREIIYHGATRAFHLGPCALWHECVWTKSPRRRHQVVVRATSSGETGVHIARAALGSTPMGAAYFGHWLSDDLTCARLATFFGEVVAPFQPSYLHRDYVNHFQLTIRPVASAQFDQLTMFDDRAQNEHKLERYRLLQHRLAATVGLDPAALIRRHSFFAAPAARPARWLTSVQLPTIWPGEDFEL